MTESDFIQNLDTKTRILFALLDKPMRAKDIASVTHLTYTTVVNWLKVLELSGLVKKAGKDSKGTVYEITRSGRAVVRSFVRNLVDYALSKCDDLTFEFYASSVDVVEDGVGGYEALFRIVTGEDDDFGEATIKINLGDEDAARRMAVKIAEGVGVKFR